MITVVLGGSRSGKSEVAERLAAAAAGPVTYLATMTVGDDRDLAHRVALHRARRPADWRTVEVGDDLPQVLETLGGTVLLDSLGVWLAARGDFVVDAEMLCGALTARSGDTVIVSDEVGMGVVPPTALGGAFRDALGSLNQAVALVADQVFLVVAGRILPLDKPPEA